MVEMKVGLAHLRIHLSLILTKKGQVTRQHDVHDHAQAPAVTLLAIVALKHLRRKIVRRTDHSGEFGTPPIL